MAIESQRPGMSMRRSAACRRSCITAESLYDPAETTLAYFDRCSDHCRDPGVPFAGNDLSNDCGPGCLHRLAPQSGVPLVFPGTLVVGDRFHCAPDAALQ